MSAAGGVDIEIVVKDWSVKDLGNLLELLGDDKSEATVSSVVNRFKWLYHSKSRATLESGLRSVARRVFASREHKKHSDVDHPENIRTIPKYNSLILEACKKVNAYEVNAPLSDMEIYLPQAIIVSALHRMKPSERMKFFSTELKMDDIVESANVDRSKLKGPATTMAMLGLAQASGFGVYMYATTALGFLTHAVGVTLPFAVYTGMTSTIAFILGPAGWLSVGLWGAWKLTGPKWKRMIPGLIYIIYVNSRKRLN